MRYQEVMPSEARQESDCGSTVPFLHDVHSVFWRLEVVSRAARLSGSIIEHCCMSLATL